MTKKVNNTTFAQMLLKGVDTTQKELAQQIAADQGIRQSFGVNTDTWVKDVIKGAILASESKKAAPAVPYISENAFRNAMSASTQHMQSPIAVLNLQAHTAEKEYDDYVASQEHKDVIAGIQKQSQNVPYVEKIAGAPSLKRDPKEQELKAAADYHRQQVDAEKDRQLLQQRMAVINSWSQEDRDALEAYVREKDKDDDPFVNSNPFEFYKHNKRLAELHDPLAEKYGKEQLDMLEEAYGRYLHGEDAKNTVAETTEAVDNVPGAIGHNLLSVGANIAGSIYGLTGRAGEMFTRTGQFRTLEEYNPGDLLNLYSDTVRGATAQNIAGEDGSIGRQALSVGYQGVMSFADTIARTMVGGKVGSLGLAAAGSFSRTMTEASKQGATPTQAAILAVGSAAIEAATEYIPLDEMLKAAKGGAKGGKAIIKEALRQAGIEATTEEIGLVGNLLYEAAVLREKSSYQQKIGELVANGYSYEEAKKQADKDIWNEALNTAMVSGFSGFLSGGGSAYVGSMTDKVIADTAAELAQKAPPSPAPAPMTEGLKDFDNAAAIANGLELNVPYSIDTESHIKYDNSNISKEGVQVYGAEEHGDGGNGRNTENDSGIIAPQSTEYSSGNVPTGDPGRIPGGNGKGTLHTADSEGSRITPEISERIRDTAITDSDGRPLAVYHFTDNMGFDVFAKGDTGFHFGSAEQAQNRASDKKTNSGRVFRAYLNIKNPIQVDSDIMGWHPSGTALKLWSMGILTDAEKDQVVSAYKMGDGYDSQSAVTLRAILEGKGYDGIVYPNAHEGVGDSYMAFRDDQIIRTEIRPYGESTASGNNSLSLGSTPTTDTQMGASNPSAEGERGIKGTGAAEANFSGKAAYQDLLYEGNVQPDRPGDVRPMEVPKKDSYGRNVTEFAANAYGAEVTPDSMANEIESLIQDGALGFDTRSNREALEDAAKDIQKKGRASVRNNITRNIANGKLVDGDIEKALLLYAEYAGKKGKRAQEDASEIFVDLATMAHMSGRNLQLFGLLRRMTPEGQLMTAKKNVQRYVDSLNQGRSRKNQASVDIPRELEDAVRTATSDEQRQEAMDAIYKNAAAQIKPTLGEMWDAWRNLAMLGNAKTHLRNAGGSAAMRPYALAKRTIGTAMENIFVAKENRTKALLGFGEESRKLLKWAESDGQSNAAKNMMENSFATGNDVRNAIEENRVILPGVLETARRKNLELMENTDMVFKQREYALSLASFLKARGYTAEQVQSGQVPQAVLDEGRQLAVKEALKATFNDRNRFSDAISKFRVKGSDPVSKAMNAMAKGILPFTRTPANVLVRAVEYSPAGIAKGLGTLITKVKSGEATVADGIDQIAAGLTGTGAMMLGAALSYGLIPGFRLVGKLDDEEKEAGAREYSLQVGDNYYGIEWLAPANMPLFMGANMLHNLQNKQDAGEDIDGWDVISGLMETTADMIDPMLELSMMSSLNDIVENVAYEESAGDKVIAAVTNAATNYFTQGLPTIFGQMEQAAEKTKTSTFVNADNPAERTFQRVAGSVTQRIPGVDLFQKERVDKEGKTVENEGGWMQRAFNAFVNPVNTYKENTGPVWDEKKRLNESQPQSVSSPSIPKKITYTDANGEVHKNHLLTAQEYSTLEKAQLQTENAMLETLIQTKEYAAMTDKQKAKVFDYVQEYARETGRSQALPGYEISEGWIKDVKDGGTDVIIDKVITGAFTDAFGNFTDGSGEPAEDLRQAYGLLSNMSTGEINQFAENAGGRVRYYIEAKRAGVKEETFLDLYGKYRDIEAMDLSAGDKAAKWAHTLDQAKNAGQITALGKIRMKDSMVFRYSMPANTDKYDQLTEAGLDADTALDVTKLMEGITGTGSIDPKTEKPSVRNTDKYSAIAKSGYSDAETDLIMKAYMPDSDKTELKYETIRNMGYSPQEYAETYRAYSDNSKNKDRIQQAIKNLGYTDQEAQLLYKIYYGSYFK